MPLKGSVMRQYYSEPWMRTSADIDILIHQEDIDAAVEILTEKLRYQNNGKYAHDIQMFSPNGVHLELHFETIEENSVANANAVMSNIWENSYIKENTRYHYIASNEMFYFYHVAHMAKHVMHSGCGVRFFLDLWLLNHNVDFNDSKKRELLKIGGLSDFERVVKRLSEVWFSEMSHNDLTITLQEYIINGGIYGTAENRMMVDHISKGGHIGYALSRIFLPYDIIKNHYPILKKHKWLLPFCEIRRWCKLIFCGGLKRSKAELNKSAKIKVSERERMGMIFEKLGLS